MPLHYRYGFHSHLVDLETPPLLFRHELLLRRKANIALLRDANISIALCMSPCSSDYIFSIRVLSELGVQRVVSRGVLSYFPRNCLIEIFPDIS
jgi:hypothetical protein